MIDFDGKPAFEIVAPTIHSIPLVFNSPHSGASYPPEFLASSRLNSRTIRRSEDSFVDLLFEKAAELGAPLLKANFPRAWLDLNREPYELDPRMFQGNLPSFANVTSIRVAGGLGTVPRIVSDGEEIYSAPLDVSEALERIERLYKPYHRVLRQLVDTTCSTFGSVLLVDCHSMPSQMRSGTAKLRPDIVLGDRYGTSCAGEITDIAAQKLSGLGYSVSRNKPYAGGFITENYGEPGKGVHAMQIEINRSLYMNEQTWEKRPCLPKLQNDLRSVMELLAIFFENRFLGQAAAE